MTTINETHCTIKHANKSYTNRGAYLDANCGLVYLVERNGALVATKWNGDLISDQVKVTNSWKRYTRHAGYHIIKSIRVTINGITYHGRYGSDWSQLCRIRRVKT